MIENAARDVRLSAVLLDAARTQTTPMTNLEHDIFEAILRVLDHPRNLNEAIDRAESLERAAPATAGEEKADVIVCQKCGASAFCLDNTFTLGLAHFTHGCHGPVRPAKWIGEGEKATGLALTEEETRLVETLFLWAAEAHWLDPAMRHWKYLKEKIANKLAAIEENNHEG